ncbi:MAG: Spi family protease inhibitor, partial [Muribaculaceae bacterium]|nr:Spi family protease inhibitor [Muribaculaceae bacterium]
MRKLFMVKALMALATVAVSQQTFAGNINESAARNTAKQFIQQQVSAGTFKASRGVNLALAHAEASATVAGAHDYYAYNLEGGGWIIVAGEDRAATVLGYSDQGELNFNNLPCNFEGL